MSGVRASDVPGTLHGSTPVVVNSAIVKVVIEEVSLI